MYYLKFQLSDLGLYFTNIYKSGHLSDFTSKEKMLQENIKQK